MKRTTIAATSTTSTTSTTTTTTTTTLTTKRITLLGMTTIISPSTATTKTTATTTTPTIPIAGLPSSFSRRSLISARVESFHRRAHRLLSVGLQIEKLETLLTRIAPEFCEDRELMDSIQQQFRGLAARKHFRNRELTRDEMNDIVDILNLILNTSPQLPPKLVAYVHSTIGLVRQLVGENDSAIISLTKALWLETATQNPDTCEIGLTVHRLGISHGRNRNYPEALVMLKKALLIYKVAGLEPNHTYVTNANDEFTHVQKIQQQRSGNASKQFTSGRSVDRQSWKARAA